MFKHVDELLNSFTMYKVLVYGLGGMVAWALLMSVAGVLAYTSVSLLLSVSILLVACYLANKVFSFILSAPINLESAAITALILFFLLPPVVMPQDGLVAVMAGFAAMATKYVFAYHKKHLFNPAAAGAVVVGALGIGGATWWVATPVMMPITAIVGFLIVRKIRRWWLFISFLVCAVVSITVFNLPYIDSYQEYALELLKSWPLLFFGTVMLTEPLTTPPTYTLQVIYGMVVGILLGVPYRLGPIYASPEASLMLANLFSFVVSPKYKLFLQLDAKRKVSATVHEFIFKTSQKIQFKPGQYMEWTLPHAHTDSRGNRRYFTIASSPTEDEIKLGIKLPEKASTFKQHLVELEKSGTMVASQLAGDFTMPADTTKKLVFIAGGIGVTPFRSMAKYMTDTKERRDVVLLYSSSTADDFPYQDIFRQAEPFGWKTIYCLTKAESAPANWSGLVGRLTADHIATKIPDFKDRIFYLSGPNAMVTAYAELLQSLGIPASAIKEDYFPGF